jgi:SET domain-containing protein
LPLEPRINPSYACFGIEVRRSHIHRWGVFALEPIPAWRKVIEYTGERIGRAETKRRAADSRQIYLFELNSYWCVDGSAGGSGAEFINHSCEPNLFSKVVHGHILYVSRRTIAPGEELTVDYRFRKDAQKVPCRCGTARCRGTINLK